MLLPPSMSSPFHGSTVPFDYAATAAWVGGGTVIRQCVCSAAVPLPSFDTLGQHCCRTLMFSLFVLTGSLLRIAELFGEENKNQREGGFSPLPTTPFFGVIFKSTTPCHAPLPSMTQRSSLEITGMK